MYSCFWDKQPLSVPSKCSWGRGVEGGRLRNTGITTEQGIFSFWQCLVSQTSLCVFLSLLPFLAPYRAAQVIVDIPVVAFLIFRALHNATQNEAVTVCNL